MVEISYRRSSANDRSWRTGVIQVA